MPASKKITKEMIAEAALRIFRRSGLESVTSRKVAQELGCSTQPLYVEYKNMEELKADIVKIVVDRQRNSFDENISDSENFVYRAYGKAFLKFAQAEPFLFKQIYVIDSEMGKSVDKSHLEKIFDILEKRCGYSHEAAEKIHQTSFTFIMGLAILISSNYREISEAEMDEYLEKMIMIAFSLYGTPPELMKDEKFRSYYESLKTKFA
jgi:AcrR family transcriptional regulator